MKNVSVECCNDFVERNGEAEATESLSFFSAADETLFGADSTNLFQVQRPKQAMLSLTHL